MKKKYTVILLYHDTGFLHSNGLLDGKEKQTGLYGGRVFL